MRRVWFGILVAIALFATYIYCGFLVYSPKYRYTGKVISDHIVRTYKDNQTYYSFTYVDKNNEAWDVKDYTYPWDNSEGEARFFKNLIEGKFIKPTNMCLGIFVYPISSVLIAIFLGFLICTISCAPGEKWYKTSQSRSPHSPDNYCDTVMRYGESCCDGCRWMCSICHRTTISKDRVKKWRVHFNMFWR